jgi:thiol-disulfide isomerase/thioredoxin
VTLINALFALVALLAMTVGVGIFVKWSQGRPRRAILHEVIEPSRLGAPPLGERATLLQFSSAFCAPCRATRRVLGEVAELVPGVTHVEVDAEHHLDVVRSLRVLRTPTTLILDPDGRELSRASGLPQRDQVLAALDRA